MKPESALRHFVLAFLLALAGYAVFYAAIEHRRTRQGPWEVTFTNTTPHTPGIVIHHPKLGISNVRISFAGQPAAPTNQCRKLSFSQPQAVPYDVPFGRCVFMDTTFLPGTVTFQLFGHEIELLPRVLVVDHKEQPWRSDSSIALPPLPLPPP